MNRPKSFLDQLMESSPRAAALLCKGGRGEPFSETFDADNGYRVILSGNDRGYGDWAEGEARAYRQSEDEDAEDTFGIPFSFCCKHYIEGSHYGIDNGKISKLEICLGTKDGSRRNCVINYDRGWDVKFSDFQRAYEAVYKAILNRFN